MSNGAAGSGVSDTRRFAAFISYAHADAAVAAKLQARLERYRLPPHIAAERAVPGSALGRIFRDREDLAAAPSLSDAIRTAIAQAEALVVICSPDAQQSHWVGEEIALFRALHPQRSVLAVLVRGEPEAAFPAALTAEGTEPLAADLRKDGDGKSLGFLKIVAGIAGVPLDALIQRDAQRRLRRVMWITAGALAAMLIMGIMTAFAINARNEAARQRASAEGLVEYMLTDLRRELKSVGKLELQSSVNQRVMAHYNAQGALSNLPDSSLERRARVLHAIGEDAEKRGDFAGALNSFRTAHRHTEALLKRAPDNGDRIFAHAQSEYWIGFIHEQQKDWTGALNRYGRYKALAEQLAAIEPGTIRSNLERGYASSNLGIIYLSQGQALDRSRSEFQQAISLYQKVEKSKPGDPAIQHEIANAYAWISDTYYREANWAVAAQYRQKELAIQQALLAGDPSNADRRFRLFICQRALAKIAAKQGYFRAANVALADVQRGVAALVSRDPENSEWRDLAENTAKDLRWIGQSLQ